MDNERHSYLVSRGYAVEARAEGHVPTLNGERIGPPRSSREAAWRVCDDHSYARAMGGKKTS